MESQLICKIPTIEEMNKKWDYEIQNSQNSDNWIIWKTKALENFQKGLTIPYYGILKGQIICEATAMLSPTIVQNHESLVDSNTAYLSAFRTIPDFQGKGYFSQLFKFMLEDLKRRGYTKVTLGVEPTELKNKEIYAHYGFNEYIKTDYEVYPDGTKIEVEYYGKKI